MKVNSSNKIVYEWHDFLETIREARRRCDDLEGQWAAMTDQARHTPHARALGQELAKTTAEVLMREEFIEDCDHEWGKRFAS